MCSIAARRSANGLEIAVHDERVDVAHSWMEKGPWECANNLKFEDLPESYGAVVSADHKIELHGAKSALACAVKGMSAHGAGYAATGGGDGGHVAAIGD